MAEDNTDKQPSCEHSDSDPTTGTSITTKDDQTKPFGLSLSTEKIYHERQYKQLCALHALNNLFQCQAFTKHDLDAICKELAPNSRFFNPHKSSFGLGCYDVNVILCALSKKDYDVNWFDKRKDLSGINLDQIFGLILNVPNTPSNAFLAIPFNYLPSQAQVWTSEKHWIAVKKIGPHYYNLDSKLQSPMCIGDSSSLIEYLKNKLPLSQVEILMVVPRLATPEAAPENQTAARSQPQDP